MLRRGHPRPIPCANEFTQLARPNLSCDLGHNSVCGEEGRRPCRRDQSSTSVESRHQSPWRGHSMRWRSSVRMKRESCTKRTTTWPSTHGSMPQICRSSSS